ncbi:DUF3748 domain-containing protein [Pedobacter mucosus]|uniref:DUF3748 domain-containing protein n=1 Tax=Pedobacter mucosus TaxID=2895286 RepID=UPI001EE3CBA2|nr:DUF3748 domain-containing protein [Pedobacter mucosus]UKT63950.1 DUF3748 domain-containing protein [Pedobacter mucosus]
MKEIQLTKEPHGHMLNSTQVFSKDSNWLVFDTRNQDNEISSTASIAMVNTKTGEIKMLYQTKNQTEFGPGVGAATFSPVDDKVIFIHGLNNSNAANPYSITRRTGIAINTNDPNKAIFMDARCIEKPFTAGALRGGTHAHTWSKDGNWLSFTYDDYVIEQFSRTFSGVQNLRTIGIMIPRSVIVKTLDDEENFSGTMFSIIIAKITENPKLETDEINKAFDECWIGNGYLKQNGQWQQKAIAFQGNVKNEDGNVKTEIFVVDLPKNLIDITGDQMLPGYENKRLNVPKGITQRRITFTKYGIKGPRHWLRSNPEGTQIAFLSQDEFNFINVFCVSPNSGKIKQISNHKFNIQGGINFSPDGKYITYIAGNAVFVTDVETSKSTQLTKNDLNANDLFGCVNWSPDGKIIAFNRYVLDEITNQYFVQIFLITNDDHSIMSFD